MTAILGFDWLIVDADGFICFLFFFLFTFCFTQVRIHAATETSLTQPTINLLIVQIQDAVRRDREKR